MSRKQKNQRQDRDHPDSLRSEITTQQRGSVISIYVGDTEQSRVDVTRPDRLEFEYMQQMNVVLKVLVPEPAPVRALHIGAGGCALPLAWELRRPGSRQLAIESDAAMAELARDLFPLPRKPQLRIRVADGGEALSASQAKFQVIVRDAFLKDQVPEHLTTLQWALTVQNHLTDDGIYLANSSHGAAYSSRAEIAATTSVFANTLIIGDSKVIKGTRSGNIVTVAWDTPRLIEFAEIDRRLRRLPLPVSVLGGKPLHRWLGGSKPSSNTTEVKPGTA